MDLIQKVSEGIVEHAPTILLAGGVISEGIALGATVKSTLEVPDILKDYSNRLEEIEKTIEANPSGYSEEDRTVDVKKNKMETAKRIAKLYILPAGTAALSFVCYLSGHHILARRYSAATAAFTAVSTAFAKYRENVVNDIGKDADFRYLHSVKQKDIQEKQVTDKDGEIKTIKVVDGSDSENPYDYSIYAKVFDTTNRYYESTPDYNLLFIKSVQNQMNDRLKAVGHVFLNEVYDALGFEHTKAGSVVGWYIPEDKKESIGDNYIDFGIFMNIKNPQNAAFINGKTDAVVLDFNVDGVIYDLMKDNEGLSFRRIR